MHIYIYICIGYVAYDNTIGSATVLSCAQQMAKSASRCMIEERAEPRSFAGRASRVVCLRSGERAERYIYGSSLAAARVEPRALCVCAGVRVEPRALCVCAGVSGPRVEPRCCVGRASPLSRPRRPTAGSSPSLWSGFRVRRRQISAFPLRSALPSRAPRGPVSRSPRWPAWLGILGTTALPVVYVCCMLGPSKLNTCVL